MEAIKCTVLCLLVVLFCSCKRNQTHQISVENLPELGRTVVIMNPTVKNIKTFLYLTENKIFPIQGKYSLVGVYHKKSTNNYRLSFDYLMVNKIENVRLLGIDFDLNANILYKNNSCTETFKALFENSKGIIFFGGPDIPPACYGQETHLLTEITDPYRHYLEISFLYHLIGGYQDSVFDPLLNRKPSFPILGICLGMQSMNIAAGGTLIQDIPMQLYGLETADELLKADFELQHRNYNTNFGMDSDLIWNSFHTLKYEPKGFFDSLNMYLPQAPYIWSSHHQCINILGKNLIPFAWSNDGKIIEAVRHAKYPNVLGVQFHPESLAIFDDKMKLKILPFDSLPKSYAEKFPVGKSVEFHRRLWNYLGERFSE